MRTMLYLNPDVSHRRIEELREACEAYAAKFPNHAPGHFTFQGERWQETAQGYCLSIGHTIDEPPLVLRGVPLHLIELEDSVEDLGGSKRLDEGIYEVDGIRAEVDSHLANNRYYVYTVKITGRDLATINHLYSQIRQGLVEPTVRWARTAPAS